MSFWVNSVLELVSYVAWPLTVIVGIVLLKEPFSSLLSNISKIEHKDTKISINSLQQEIVVPPKDDLRVEVGMLPYPYNEAEKLIIEQLNKYPVEEHLNRLTSQLAIERVEFAFERVYRNIFTSQIEVLKKLRDAEDKTISIADTEDIYLAVAAKEPSVFEGYSGNDWRRFLVSNSMILIDQDKVSLTEIGVGFLGWIARLSLSESPTSY